MNTPKTRPPKRHNVDPHAPSRPDGKYATGLWNERYTMLVGRIATYWPVVEDAMIGVLDDLMGGRNQSALRLYTEGNIARQIFRSILSNQARRKIMLSLLERSKLNRDKDSFYDDVLNEFDKLNRKRNDYLHGIWFTRAPFPSGEVYLSEESVDDHHWLESRPVPYKELEDVLVRMNRLNTSIQLRHKQPQTGRAPSV